jgi:hypothetical protein
MANAHECFLKGFQLKYMLKGEKEKKTHSTNCYESTEGD